jgi:hypothetical protein
MIFFFMLNCVLFLHFLPLGHENFLLEIFTMVYNFHCEFFQISLVVLTLFHKHSKILLLLSLQIILVLMQITCFVLM